MGHTKPELIADLKKELDSIRELEGIKEKSFGVFYFKSIPFLHFHNKEGQRWADVKTPRGYKRVDNAPDANGTTRKNFLKAVKTAYEVLAAEKARK